MLSKLYEDPDAYETLLVSEPLRMLARSMMEVCAVTAMCSHCTAVLGARGHSSAPHTHAAGVHERAADGGVRGVHPDGQ